MADLLLDTDVLIDHFRGIRPLALDSSTALSVVTRAELFAGRAFDEGAGRLALSAMVELPVDRPVAEQAGRVRRATGIRLPDALIAATALVHGLALLSRNRRHFSRVDGLELREP